MIHEVEKQEYRALVIRVESLEVLRRELELRTESRIEVRKVALDRAVQK